MERGVGDSRADGLPRGAVPASRSQESQLCADVLQMRVATFFCLIVGVLLLVGGAALGVRERSQRRLDRDHGLLNRADADASRLQAYFARARSIILITGHNPAFRE